MPIHHTRVRNSAIVTARHPEQPRHVVTWREWEVTCSACELKAGFRSWKTALATANGHTRFYSKARR